MKRQLIWMAVAFCLLVFALDVQRAHAADAVVGTGNPASCTEAAFDSALAAASTGGGTITFNCGPATTTISFTLFKIVNTGNVTIDGGGRIVLKAGNNERHFFAGAGVTFRLQNIILRDGNSLVSMNRPTVRESEKEMQDEFYQDHPARRHVSAHHPAAGGVRRE